MTNGHNVPILGQQPTRIAALVPPPGLARKLDENGTMPIAQIVSTPNGQQALIGRDAYMDAEELLAAFRQIVREEIARANDP